ncbi:MAG: UvrD-helicase domain-containing protein [Candidatus Uhrbacteria bacterium]
MEENLMEKLNEEQLKAVTHREGPLMIIAGAGTGKTMAITQRIAWLIEQKLAAPDEILALTFTEKAAAEMEERVDVLLPMGYVDLWISTFHAFCERVLSDYGVEIGLGRNMRVLNEVDTWLLMRQNFDRFDLKHYRPKGNPMKFMKALLQHFSRAKDEVITPEDYLKFAEGERANLDATNSSDDATAEVERLSELANAYHTYQQILLENESLDFGDLIMYTLELLKTRPKVLEELRGKFKYILVDEFQDTNWAQYELVKLLAAPKNNLTVVGDDDQSIYKFRGASLANILQFGTDYPDTKKIVLTKNYRTVQSILDHAYKFIQMNNPNRLEREGLSKELKSQREKQGKIEHLHYATLEQEIEGVADRILEIKERNRGSEWSDFGILVRANDSANNFLAALERRGIPYQFLALRGLYTKPIVLDLMAYLHVIDNPYDSPSWYRILTHPDLAISPDEIAKLNYEAQRAGKATFDVLKAARAISELTESTMAKIEQVVSVTNEIALEAKNKKVTEIIISTAQKTGLLEWVNSREEQEKLDSFRYLHQFFERVKRFEGRHDHPVLKNFLHEFAHERSAGEEGALQFDIEGGGPDMVKIMTVHGSKGLEFKYVFVTNLIDRRFPTSERKDPIPLPDGLVQDKVPEGNAHLEEERRLFYVAVTRAKDELYLTSAEDYGGVRKRKISRFLHEIGLAETEGSVADAVGPFDDERRGIKFCAPTDQVVLQIPKQFSFTQMAAFSTCPLQYKFAHLLKIPVFGKYQMSFGKTMHNTLQEYFKRWLERGRHAQQGLFDETDAPADSIPVGLEELLEIYSEQWIDEWYPKDDLREEYRATGKESLKGYFKLIESEPPKPKALETGFTLKIDDLVLKGRIDRIDEFDDGVEIIDYKTGKPKAEDKLSRDDKKQLLIYQIAAAECLGLKPKKLTFHYLENNSQVSFFGTEKELEKLKDELVSSLAKIRESHFNATPGFHCQFCDFSSICEFRKL